MLVNLGSLYKGVLYLIELFLHSINLGQPCFLHCTFAFHFSLTSHRCTFFPFGFLFSMFVYLWLRLFLAKLKGE